MDIRQMVAARWSGTFSNSQRQATNDHLAGENMIITEYELRANWHKNKPEVITVPPGSVITPAARDFLRDKGIKVQIEGDGMIDLNRINYSSSRHSQIESQESKDWDNHMRAAGDPVPSPSAGVAPPSAGVAPVKPEHMTHLHGSNLVCKNHPVIGLRGQLDLFQCQLMEAELFFQERGERELVDQMEEIAEFARQLMTAEVLQQPFTLDTLIGYTADELREVSHHPGKYLGVKHTYLSISQGPIAMRLHCLRSKAREVELYASQAFTDLQGACARTDIVTALNRLSSAFYILACKARAQYENRVDTVSTTDDRSR
jgi:ethanolamine utilization cobalamin adenosyltransferase